MKCQAIIDSIERLAPRRLAYDWDNPGLLVGDPSQEVKAVLVCLDVSLPVIEKAIALGANMIISHHPMIFRGVKRLRTDQYDGKMFQLLMKHDIAAYGAHTNLDCARGGVNDMLAEAVGLTNLEPLDITDRHELVKLAVYVPVSHAEAVREAIAKAGAGYIGNYSSCSFSIQGEGRFLPMEGTNPYIGSTGKLEIVDEVRIETVMPVELERKVVKSMLKAHPYEEAAYDLYPLRNEGVVESCGRIGYLPEAMPLEAFAKQVCKGLHTDHVRITKSNDKLVRKVGLCSGAGSEFIGKAFGMGADTFLCGDTKYHEVQQAMYKGINVIDAGHFPTEFGIVRTIADYLREDLQHIRGGKQLQIYEDDVSEDLYKVILAD